MSQTESKIRLVFEGAERGVAAAAAKASAAVRSLDDDNSRLNKSADRAGAALGVMGKGMLALGAANGAIQVVGGVAGALTQLAPAALLLPGALLAGGAAMGTFKIATAGMGKALEAGLSGNMEKFAKDTKNMAPAMQDAAKAVVGLKPQIDDLKHTVQGNFWGGFSDGIKSAGATYLPILKTGLGDIATSLGKVGLNALKATQSPIFTSSIAGILDRTSTTLGNMSGAAGDVLTGFVRLGAAGATYLPKLGTGIGDVAKRFADWSVKVVQSGKFFDWVDGAIQGFKDLGGIVQNIGSIIGTVFTGLGGVVESPLARIRELTGQVAEFLKSVQGQDALRALGEVLRTVGEQIGRILDAGLDELGPTLVALAPPAKEIATALGDLLVGAIRTLGPLIRGVADTFSAFPGSAGLAATAVVAFVAAVKTIKAVNAVTEFLGIGNGILGIGAKAEGASGKVGGLATKLGGLKTLGIGLALGAIAVGMDQINKSSEQGNLSGWNGELHDIARILTGDWGNPIADINAQLDQVNQKWSSGQAPVQQWAGTVGRSVEGARQSVRVFLAELFGIDPPPPIPLHVDTKPASNEFLGWQHATSDGVTTAQLDADPAKANAARAGWGTATMATTATAHLNAEAAGANSTVAGWKGSAMATTGQAHLDAETGRATGSVQAWKGSADRTWGTVHANADTRQATADLARLTQTRYMTIEAIVRTRALPPGHTAATGGAVIGGAIVRGFDVGGPITGPGTGTSDTAGLFALSNGEFVATKREVDNAGGPAAFGRLMDTLDRGPRGMAAGGSPMRASARAAMRTPVPASSLSGGGVVTLKVAPGGDGALATLIMRMIRENKIQLKAA